MTATQYRILKKDSKPSSNWEPINVDWLILPLASQAQLTPASNVLRASTMFAAEDGINLSEREF